MSILPIVTLVNKGSFWPGRKGVWVSIVYLPVLQMQSLFGFKSNLHDELDYVYHYDAGQFLYRFWYQYIVINSSDV